MRAVGDSDIEVGIFDFNEYGLLLLRQYSQGRCHIVGGKTVSKDMRSVTTYISFRSGHCVVNLILMHVHRVGS